MGARFADTGKLWGIDGMKVVLAKNIISEGLCLQGSQD